MTSEAALSLSSERLRHIDDPLLLAKLGPEGPVRSLLEDIARARLDVGCEKALYLCNAAVECARKRGDQAELALAYLYKADLQARSDQLEPAINLASRARQILAMCGERYWRDCHNVMVAQLQLARLQAAQDPESAQLCYQEAGLICQKLEAENKETGRSKAAKLYEQILTEIQHALHDVSNVIKEQYTHKRVLNSIPILQLGNGPETAIGSPAAIVYVATGEFKIEERTYFLDTVDETMQHTLDLQPGGVHFALRVPRDGWLVPTSKVQDYALVRHEKQITQGGPAVSLTKDELVSGRFDRDATTGRIRFVPSKDSVKIIGKNPFVGQGSVIGLLKPIV
jgi:tetratricopeptide (TPR) repeat protein